MELAIVTMLYVPAHLNDLPAVICYTDRERKIRRLLKNIIIIKQGANGWDYSIHRDIEKTRKMLYVFICIIF